MNSSAGAPQAEAPSKNGWSGYVLCGALSAGIFAFDLSMALGVAIGVLYILVVLMAMWLPQRKMIFVMAGICSCLTMTGYVLKPSVLDMWKALFNRALTLLVIWAAAILGFQRKLSEARRQESHREREKALNEVRMLKGLLPICASCKKIRDDEGYWIQIEKFIHEHSEANFSHGICPDCADVFFPARRSSKGKVPP